MNTTKEKIEKIIRDWNTPSEMATKFEGLLHDEMKAFDLWKHKKTIKYNGLDGKYWELVYPHERYEFSQLLDKFNSERTEK